MTILSHTIIYYIHTYIWTHTHKCTHTHTHTRTQNNRKDWNTHSRDKRAWHSGWMFSRIYNLVKLSRKEGRCSPNLPIKS